MLDILGKRKREKVGMSFRFLGSVKIPESITVVTFFTMRKVKTEEAKRMLSQRVISSLSEELSYSSSARDEYPLNGYMCK